MQTNYHYQKCKTIKTNTRILTFNRLQLPSFINIGYLRVGVENYIHSPLRCTICQTFGHHFSVEITVPSVTYAVYVYLFHYPKYQVCPQHRVKNAPPSQLVLSLTMRSLRLPTSTILPYLPPPLLPLPSHFPLPLLLSHSFPFPVPYSPHFPLSQSLFIFISPSLHLPTSKFS